jgi:hypothetical protein
MEINRQMSVVLRATAAVAVQRMNLMQNARLMEGDMKGGLQGRMQRLMYAKMPATLERTRSTCWTMTTRRMTWMTCKGRLWSMEGWRARGVT